VTDDEAHRCFAEARVASLATADVDGRPHVVPIVFAVAGDTVYSAVDSKPKRTTSLRRLANLQANPRATLLVHHYDDEDWTRLWWVRADTTAEIVDDPAAMARPIALLRERYPQYRQAPPEGPVIALTVERWSGWAY
jgi:PPOX class probable F420-dependent enzyme